MRKSDITYHVVYCLLEHAHCHSQNTKNNKKEVSKENAIQRNKGINEASRVAVDCDCDFNKNDE